MNDRPASGEGMFETILTREGRPLYLAEHLRRLRSSLSSIGIRTALVEAHVAEQIGRVLKENDTLRGEARVRLTVSRDSPEILIEARPYDRPDTAKGWHLQMDPSFLATTEARHKSLAYQSYLARLRDTMNPGFDDAILVNGKGKICETTVAALLFRHKNTWIIPATNEQLPSLSRAIIVELLMAEGHETQTAQVSAESIPATDEIWACNSLMGAMAVRAVNEHILPAPDDSLLNHINTRFLSL